MLDQGRFAEINTHYTDFENNCGNTSEYILKGPVIEEVQASLRYLFSQHNCSRFSLPLDILISGSHRRASPLFVSLLLY